MGGLGWAVDPGGSESDQRAGQKYLCVCGRLAGARRRLRETRRSEKSRYERAGLAKCNEKDKNRFTRAAHGNTYLAGPPPYHQHTQAPSRADQPGAMPSKGSGSSNKGGVLLRPIQKAWLRKHSRTLVLGIGSLITLWYRTSS